MPLLRFRYFNEFFRLIFAEYVTTYILIYSGGYCRILYDKINTEELIDAYFSKQNICLHLLRYNRNGPFLCLFI